MSSIEQTNKKSNKAAIVVAVIMGIFVLFALGTIIVSKVIVANTECDDPYSPLDGPGGQVAKKPMIYLYPTDTTDIKVKLGNPSLLSSTYPKYSNEWNVTVDTEGKLTDKKTGRELYGLYWEGYDYKTEMKDEGFVVAGENVSDFLEDKLALLGLNDREAEEFIVYWLPIMEKNKYNYVHFDLNEEMDAYMPLEISPKPETTIRIMMTFKALDNPVKVKAQKLETPERKGFTVVEWGGSEIK